MLDALMAGKSLPQSPILIAPTYVTVRRTVDVLAGSDVLLANALCFIRQNYMHLIGVTDVAQHVGASTRVLERRFRKAFDRTVLHMIREARIAAAKKELATSEQSIKIVAQHCGFGSNPRFTHVFREETGLTPQAYRRKLRSDASVAAGGNQALSVKSSPAAASGRSRGPGQPKRKKPLPGRRTYRAAHASGA